MRIREWDKLVEKQPESYQCPGEGRECSKTYSVEASRVGARSRDTDTEADSGEDEERGSAKRRVAAVVVIVEEQRRRRQEKETY